MTDNNKIDEILGRALRDRNFRVKLVNDPKGAAKDVGLTEAEIQLISGGLAIGNSLLNPGIGQGLGQSSPAIWRRCCRRSLIVCLGPFLEVRNKLSELFVSH